MLLRNLLIIVAVAWFSVSTSAQNVIRVTIKTTTPNAAIFINGVERGVDSCLVRLRPDKYTIRATCEGRRDWEGEITFNGDVHSQIFRIPEMEQIRGTLSINYLPKGSDVYLNGEFLGKSPLVGDLAKRVPIGRHSVRVESKGYESFVGMVQINENETQTLQGELKLVDGSAAGYTQETPVKASKKLKQKKTKEEKKAEKEAKKRKKAEAKEKRRLEKEKANEEKRNKKAKKDAPKNTNFDNVYSLFKTTAAELYGKSSEVPEQILVALDSCYVKEGNTWFLLKVNFCFPEGSEALQRKLSSVLFSRESNSLMNEYQRFLRSFKEIRAFDKFGYNDSEIIELNVWMQPVVLGDIRSYIARFCKQWHEKKTNKSQLRLEYILYDAKADRVLTLQDVLVSERAKVIEDVARARNVFCHLGLRKDALITYFSKKNKRFPEGDIENEGYIKFSEFPEYFTNEFKQLTKLDWIEFERLKEKHEHVDISKNRALIETISGVVDLPDKNGVYQAVPHMPSFKGGDVELMQWLSRHIKYPVEAEKKNIQGRVVVSFVVDVDGAITDVKIVQPVEPSLDKEAIRVIESMPKWNPGRLGSGEVVRVGYTVPVTFRLQ